MPFIASIVNSYNATALSMLNKSQTFPF